MSADFFDSNIFIYLFDETAPMKRAKAETLLSDALAADTGCISFQVVQETLNVITRKLLQPATPEQAQRFLHDVLMPLWRIMPSGELYTSALQVQARYSYSFYDSLIIAAAMSARARRLYSEDLQGGQCIGGVTITNPFRGCK